jgi:hypothetical protein
MFWNIFVNINFLLFSLGTNEVCQNLRPKINNCQIKKLLFNYLTLLNTVNRWVQSVTKLTSDLAEKQEEKKLVSTRPGNNIIQLINGKK